MSAERKNEQKTFYPHFVAEIAAAALLCLQLLLVLALLFAPDTGRQIDLSRQFQPRPEWYFLWLFELVKYFPGKSIFIGTLVVPALSVLLLALMPFIDQGSSGRKKASVVFYVLAVMPILLTAMYLLSR
ncbi:MAG: hypothetical protein LLF86_00660 [Nitrospiraceae bacterium]|nr:hypothetical protein [Nitrospiraceae bacterium]